MKKVITAAAIVASFLTGYFVSDTNKLAPPIKQEAAKQINTFDYQL